MEKERRKHARQKSSLIIDYQKITDDGDVFGKRASAINVSKEGICLYTPYREPDKEILLLRFPYIEKEGASFIAAKVLYSIQAPVTGFYHGLFVFPAFRNTFSYFQNLDRVSEDCSLELIDDEKLFLAQISGKSNDLTPAILGITQFFRDLHIKVNGRISSEEELQAYLVEELKKRTKHDR
ncbi:MAG: hypothetical protein JW881_06180 [Spirochaetales bacterium]|nr:hypothetical protein [Spirochaetales bacterium]